MGGGGGGEREQTQNLEMDCGLHQGVGTPDLSMISLISNKSKLTQKKKQKKKKKKQKIDRYTCKLVLYAQSTTKVEEEEEEELYTVPTRSPSLTWQ